MRILLLQARRQGDQAGPHEQAAFASVLGLDPRKVTPWDVLNGPPSEEHLREADCVMVGGSGEFGVGDAPYQPWLAQFIDVMGRLTEMDVPVFASCFGFQAMVAACGGCIETDKSRAEIGTFEVTVTEAGTADPLFGAVAPRFDAQFGHKDHVTKLPSAFVNLARTERSAYQAFRVPGKSIYATQFHPELSMEENRARSVIYAKTYTEAGYADTFEEIMASFRASDAASGLLRRFVADVIPNVVRG